MPLGFFTPLSHFSTVDSLVLRVRAKFEVDPLIA